MSLQTLNFNSLFSLTWQHTKREKWEIIFEIQAIWKAFWISKIYWVVRKRWLKKWKKEDNIFLHNDIAQIITEICSYSRRQILNIRRNLLLVYLEAEDPYTLKILSKDPCLACLAWFWCVFADHHQASRHWIWYWQNANNYQAFQLWVRTYCVSGAKT